MRLLNKFLLFSVVFGLGGCGYTVESSNQYIMFLTPGAENARCEVYVDKIKYVIYPSEERNIKKSENDMRVVCHAPGNRMVEVDIPASFTKRAIWGGPVGVAWDYASKSLYHYPSVIAVDFSLEETKSNSLPQHNSPDIRQPESYDLDEILPNEPRLNSDRYRVNSPMERYSDSLSVEFDEGFSSDSVQGQSEKGDLQFVIDGLSGEGGDSSDSAPVSIYPGQ